ncbi:caspase domain-containing protein [Desarmillaria tabescens]|uniref:Caspase domain-containing protein n=1 Tax=Armillaria tabescens TaxID=1929756 RepID=A0AA39TPX1_ARMTA|nr:caspase domain-containing protein [Desarmillaria tabescens]KAK0462343.1 caspase domain-containing protein [Desarmillaria tabescens]
MSMTLALSPKSQIYAVGRGAHLVSYEMNIGDCDHDHAVGGYSDNSSHHNFPAIPLKSGRKRALCIGINYRDRSNRLQGCIEDATKIRDFLMREQNGYKDDDIRMLTDDTDKKPTKKNILDAMSWLVKGSRPGDSLFLHYSGHGSQVADTNGDEIDGKDEDIECSDSSIIIDDEIHKILESLSSGCRLTALFDSCHSGTVLDLPYVYNCLGGRYCATKVPVSDILGDVICWSGAKDDQEGTDTPQGGVMTRAFIESLENKPVQSYQDLLHSIRTTIQRKTYKQIPQLGSSLPMDTSLDFIF